METADAARVLLMAGRVVVGGGTLVAPRRVAAVLGVDPRTNSAATYVGRLFGVRAILQVTLLAGTAAGERATQLRWGVAVDLVDAVAGAAARRTGDLPRRAAMLATAAAFGEAALGCVALTAEARRRRDK